MAQNFFTNADLRESRAMWLKEKYEEDPSAKTMVSEVIEVVRNKYGDITKEESGKIVRRAFPQSKRKRHHSGTKYFYQGIKKREKLQQPEPKSEVTTSDLQTRLEQEEGKTARVKSMLDEVNKNFNEKELYCAELERNLESERKKTQELEESQEKSRAEAIVMSKQKMIIAGKLQATEESLHAVKSKFSHFKKQVLSKDKPCRSSDNEVSNLIVIAPNQLKGNEGTNTLGSGSFGDCFLMHYRNIEVCVKYCRESTYQSVLKEAMFIRKLEGHPNLPLLFGVSPKNQIPPYIVTKFHGATPRRRNTLQDTLYSKKVDYPPKCFLILALECGRGLMHIHNKRILHNDLKCNNVLVDIIDDKPCAVIIDFGKSCFVEDARVKRIPLNERDEYRKNYPHIAPELVDMSRSQSFASDIYAYGYLLSKLSVKAKELVGAAEISLVDKPDKRASIDRVIEAIQNAFALL